MKLFPFLIVSTLIVGGIGPTKGQLFNPDVERAHADAEDAMDQVRQLQGKQSQANGYNPEAAVAAGIRPVPPVLNLSSNDISDREIQELQRYRNALDRYNAQEMDRAQQQEERQLQPIRQAPLRVQVQLYTDELESLLRMPPAQPDEALEGRRAEANRRIARLTDPATKACVQAVLNYLEPAAQELRQQGTPRLRVEAPVSSKQLYDENASSFGDPNSTQFKAAVAASKQTALRTYPDCGNPNSPLSKKMAEIGDRLEAQKNPIVYSYDAPFKVAQMAANELGIAPKP
jgi:hypothetical protein